MRSFKSERSHLFHRFASFFAPKPEGTRTVISESVVKQITGRAVPFSRTTASVLPHTMHELRSLIAGAGLKGGATLAGDLIFSFNQADFA
jgi:hypothetical protein